MFFVLTVVQKNNSAVALKKIKDQLKSFLAEKKISWVREKVLNPKKAWDVYFASSAIKHKAIIISFIKSQPIDYCWQANRNRKKKIIFSDMDGTAIQNETFNDLGGILGLEKEITAITTLGINGEIDFSQSLNRRVALLKNRAAKRSLKGLEEKIIFNPGVFNLIQTLKKNQVKTVLITAGFSPISEYVQKKIGFDALETNHYEIKANRFTGKIQGPLMLPSTKGEKVLTHLEKNSLKKSQALAIGDGMNDLTMLENVGLGVAYRGVKKLKEKIATQINATDLTSILYFQGYLSDEIINLEKT